MGSVFFQSGGKINGWGHFLADKIERVDEAAQVTDFEMQVRSGGIPSAASVCDHLAFRNALPAACHDLTIVSVKCMESVTMVNHYH